MVWTLKPTRSRDTRFDWQLRRVAPHNFVEHQFVTATAATEAKRINLDMNCKSLPTQPSAMVERLKVAR